MNTSSDLVITFLEIAPFVGTILLELSSPNLITIWSEVYEGNKEESDLDIDDNDKGRIEDYIHYSYDYHSSIQYFRFTILVSVIVFVSKLLNSTKDTEKIILGLSLVLIVFILLIAEVLIERHFRKRSPHKYYIKDNIIRIHWGSIAIIIANIIIIIWILIINIAL